MLFTISLVSIFLYFLVATSTMGLWWYCFGERHPKIDFVDSIDDMIDSIKFCESKWQGACGWLWPIFLWPLLLVALVRLLGWRLVRDEEE